MTRETLDRPASFDCVGYSTPVARFTAVTEAPRTTAPVLSVTVPVRLAATFWAMAGRAANASSSASAVAQGHPRILSILLLPGMNRFEAPVVATGNRAAGAR